VNFHIPDEWKDSQFNIRANEIDIIAGFFEGAGGPQTVSCAGFDSFVVEHI
jgi:hypothetical protein